VPTVDFARSFLTFRIDTLNKPPVTTSHKPPYSLNNARIQLDCCCDITDKRTGLVQQFVLGASCKTEAVGVEKDIWSVPNGDFVPIFSRDRFMNLKSFDRADKGVDLYPPSRGKQSERQTGQVAEAFDSLKIDIRRCESKVLGTPDEIIGAILDNRPVVARTVIEAENYSAAIDYPVKTINVNERDSIYQTDTGPLLFPDFSRTPEDFISGFELAFAAFNCPEWAEFIVRAKTPVAAGVDVYHYSKPVRLDCKNEVLLLEC
jgi:hypothetical protein